MPLPASRQQEEKLSPLKKAAMKAELWSLERSLIAIGSWNAARSIIIA
jgi:hypothetical protein